MGQKCLVDTVEDVYAGEIYFEHNDDHLIHHQLLEDSKPATSNKFLDMYVTITFDSIHFDIYHLNRQFVFESDPMQIKKHRFAPPLGTPASQVGRLTSNILSRRARWQQ